MYHCKINTSFVTLRVRNARKHKNVASPPHLRYETTKLIPNNTPQPTSLCHGSSGKQAVEVILSVFYGGNRRRLSNLPMPAISLERVRFVTMRASGAEPPGLWEREFVSYTTRNRVPLTVPLPADPATTTTALPHRTEAKVTRASGRAR